MGLELEPLINDLGVQFGWRFPDHGEWWQPEENAEQLLQVIEWVRRRGWEVKFWGAGYPVMIGKYDGIGGKFPEAFLSAVAELPEVKEQEQ